MWRCGDVVMWYCVVVLFVACRSRRRRTTEQLAKELEAERYPFKPKVNPLPAMYTGHGSSHATPSNSQV
jgi:hypothetical protein